MSQWKCLGILIAVGFCLGCGKSGGPELAGVTGTVTLDGKPQPNLNLQFTPDGAGGAPSYGGTDENGLYKLMYGQGQPGAMLGKHNVTITAREPKLDEGGNPLPGQEAIALPAKYSKTGELTAEVKAGSNTVDFKLESK